MKNLENKLVQSRAEIVTTGTEILLGDIVDTNAAWIAQQLRDVGVNLYYKSTVGDNETRMRGLLELAMSRSNLVIITGGLGPTADDITRQAIANACGLSLVLSEKALADLEARFVRFGVKMTENNRQQALLPDGAIIIENPVGTAPGFIVETETCALVALPGVPREMKHLMQATVIPYIKSRYGDEGIIRRRILRTIGIGESAIDSRLRDLMDSANPTIGLAAHTAQADVRIAARAESETSADKLLDAIEQEIRERIGSHIYSTMAEEPIEAVTGELLRTRRETVAIVESNTIGNVAHRLRNGGGERDCVVLASIVDSHEIETITGSLADSEGAFSELETKAIAMAERVRKEGNATYGVAVLGTQGQGQGIFGDRRGHAWIALATEGDSYVVTCPYGGSDEYTITRIGNHVLESLWRRLSM